MKIKFLAVLAIGIFAFSSCQQKATELTPDEAKEITKEAYIYAYPMLEHYKMMFVAAIWKESPAFDAPFNEMKNKGVLLGPEYTAIVRPNNDTFYSTVWLDLRAEPMVMSVPAISDNRYYAWQLIDLFTHNIGYIGTRETGFKAGKYLIAGPNWSGKKPKGITKLYKQTSIFLQL